MKYRKIKPESLQVAAAYQRTISKSDVNRIVKNYDERAFAVLVVGERSDGSLWVVDGQQRREAAIKLGLQFVPCVVFDSTGKTHEAEMFRLLNTHRNMTRLNKLKALLEEGDKDAKELVKTVRSLDLEIGFDGKRNWPHMRCAKALEDAYSSGVLFDVLVCIKDGWGALEDVTAFNAAIVGGLSRFYLRHGSVIQKQEFIDRIRRIAPGQLLGLCDSRKAAGGSRDEAMYEALVEFWNKGRKRDRVAVKEK